MLITKTKAMKCSHIKLSGGFGKKCKYCTFICNMTISFETVFTKQLMEKIKKLFLNIEFLYNVTGIEITQDLIKLF